MARINDIQAWRDSQRDNNTPPVNSSPAVPAASSSPAPEPVQQPQQEVSSLAGKPEELNKITYANSGIVPSMASSAEYRKDALASMNEQQFEQNKARMNAADTEYWRAQVDKNPGSIYSNIALQLASDETPEEKRKRERREQLGQVFANLGNVIGTAANLYFTAKGAVPANLDAPMRAYNERIERIRNKRQAAQEEGDAILRNAKLKDLEGARKLASERAQAQADNDRFMLNLALKRDEAAARARQQEIENDRADRELAARQRNWEEQNKERNRHNRAMENRAASSSSSSSSSSGKGGKATTNYPVMRLRGSNGAMSSERYDLNKDEDVLKMYGQGVRLGIFPDLLSSRENEYGIDLGGDGAPDLKKLNVDQLRNYILYRDNNYSKVNNQEEAGKVFGTSTGLGWGNNSNQQQLDW